MMKNFIGGFISTKLNVVIRMLVMKSFMTYRPGMVGLAPKWVKLDPKFDKFQTFSD